jgi:hypothetical protein
VSTVSIRGLNKADVLRALYDNSRPLGLGFLHFIPGPMSREEAESIVEKNPSLCFDYVKGRVVKCDLSGDDMQVGLYDRDNGQGAAEAAIRKVSQ